jgi:uncharacterized membrane protein YphA (DoxX/SURF4 family)
MLMFYRLSARTAAPLVLRLVLAVIFLTHDLAKISADTAWGTEWGYLSSPGDRVLQGTIAWGEVVFGGIALGLGVLTRPVALGGAIIQLAAAWFVSLQSPFLTEITAPDPRAGWELNLCLAGICLAVALTGAGNFSVDYLFRRHAKPGGIREAPPEASSLSPVA